MGFLLSVFVVRHLTILVFVFLVVCYVLLSPRERTKLTAQSAECVFLVYIAEHKGYCCWNLVARWMRTSWDVVFDEARLFYPCPSSDASSVSLVDPIPFLFFPILLLLLYRLHTYPNLALCRLWSLLLCHLIIL